MRRLFELYVRKWRRQVELAARTRARAERALERHEYELVGGPRDGEIQICYGAGLCPRYSYAGIYHLKSDGRLHYHESRRRSVLDLE
jgi:hypothetical protein